MFASAPPADSVDESDQVVMMTLSKSLNQLQLPSKRYSRPTTPNKLHCVLEELTHDHAVEITSRPPSTFSMEVKYITGGEINVLGLLTITLSNVTFDPINLPTNEEEVYPGMNLAIDLIKSRMSLADQLMSANIENSLPLRLCRSISFYESPLEMISDDFAEEEVNSNDLTARRGVADGGDDVANVGSVKDGDHRHDLGVSLRLKMDGTNNASTLAIRKLSSQHF
ncbi:hypothetical protein HELRODRAFT_163369 [Helobdella robusta]|uniref:Uncharacterized protein n=1 Tax=Helobdella robusta TaxID=6412 RepID=T1ETY7_HELRO|nr:hypothetical protein HELRODRAFT_163369 [Helobdella robusta]ESN96318.1 hypothetical protein HELRODRAFT_163369 [Helobdella robusta]